MKKKPMELDLFGVPIAQPEKEEAKRKEQLPTPPPLVAFTPYVAPRSFRVVKETTDKTWIIYND
jgi:hypothetical protein